MKRSGLPVLQKTMLRWVKMRKALLTFLFVLGGFFLPQSLHASAFDGKGIFSFDFDYMGAALKNNGWGLGIAYEQPVATFGSLKGSFSHVSLKPDSEHDWITTVGLGLDARIYPFNRGMNMLYLGYGIGTDFLMLTGDDGQNVYISHCPHIGYKQNFLEFVMLEAYLGYRMGITDPGDFALQSGIVKHGFEYGISIQFNIQKIIRWKKR